MTLSGVVVLYKATDKVGGGLLWPANKSHWKARIHLKAKFSLWSRYASSLNTMIDGFRKPCKNPKIDCWESPINRCHRGLAKNKNRKELKVNKWRKIFL
jgi:hypothetical protein